MKQVTIYTTPTCPYCQMAKALLKRKNVNFSEVSVTGDPATRSAMTARSNGRRSVPQIFIGATHIGGSDDLHELEHAGELDALLAS